MNSVMSIISVAIGFAVVMVAVAGNSAPTHAQGGAPAATNIQVRNGQQPGEVIITWDAAPGVSHYRIGYVNMKTDYPLATASPTGNWREAFVYVDVEAQNFEGTGTVYTIRRLEQGARHAFAVLTNNTRYGQPTWPSNPPWRYLTVHDWGETCPVGAKAEEPSRLEVLFDEIVSKTEQREAFSEIKESNMRFSVLEDMRNLRAEFVASKTDTELYYALMKLSNARRDVHVRVSPVDGGLPPPEQRPCVAAPLQVFPDYTDIRNPTFFVAAVGEGLTSPKPGDVVVGVNGRTIPEHINEFTPWIRHSTLHGLYWRVARDLARQVPGISSSLYSERLNLTLERPSGQRYQVALPYRSGCPDIGLIGSYPGFVEVMSRENFSVLLDRDRQIILLRWFDFEYSLIQDMVDLTEYAQEEHLLDYDMIIDVTYSGGGSRGAYAIQRLVDQPFRVTFGNVRLSDLGKQLINHFAGQQLRTGVPDIFGLNLSRSWLIDWARTDAAEAIRRGDAYTPPVPFKLAHLPKDSDGILQPAPLHFSGQIAIINARTRGGSHLDQFVAMLVDNDLAVFVGMPTGGYSNTWEVEEVLRFPDTGRPVVEFQWSGGHTIRPNGEVLEGNPAQPDIYIPMTRHNFQGYYQMLLDTAIAALDP